MRPPVSAFNYVDTTQKLQESCKYINFKSNKLNCFIRFQMLHSEANFHVPRCSLNWVVEPGQQTVVILLCSNRAPLVVRVISNLFVVVDWGVWFDHVLDVGPERFKTNSAPILFYFVLLLFLLSLCILNRVVFLILCPCYLSICLHPVLSIVLGPVVFNIMWWNQKQFSTMWTITLLTKEQTVYCTSHLYVCIQRKDTGKQILLTLKKLK